MEIRITSKQILTVLHILAWIIFIGLCIDAGSYLFNGLTSFFWNPQFAGFFGLTQLFNYDSGHFLVQLFFAFLVASLKAQMFYLIVRILYERKLDLERPFNPATGRLILMMSFLCFGIGIFTSSGQDYLKWLATQVTMPDESVLKLEGGDVWLFTGIAFLVIAQIFKRGIELQNESDLTI